MTEADVGFASFTAVCVPDPQTADKDAKLTVHATHDRVTTTWHGSRHLPSEPLVEPRCSYRPRDSGQIVAPEDGGQPTTSVTHGRCGADASRASAVISGASSAAASATYSAS